MGNIDTLEQMKVDKFIKKEKESLEKAYPGTKMSHDTEMAMRLAYSVAAHDFRQIGWEEGVAWQKKQVMKALGVIEQTIPS